MNFQKTIYTLLLIILPVLADAQVRIYGKVTDADNQPIEFATVRIGGTAIGTNTGLDGSYTLSVAEADTLEVIFNCIGYRENKQKIIKPRGRVTGRTSRK